MALIGAILGLLLIALILKQSEFPNYPVSDHCDGYQFFNTPATPIDPKEILKWSMNRQKVAWPEWIQFPKQGLPKPPLKSEELRVTFINHASVLLQWSDFCLITDPIFSDRASMVSFLGPKRVHEPGLSLSELPKIDAILLSHNHYDHLDIPSIKAIMAKNEAQIITGLGVQSYLKGISKDQVHALDWGQHIQLSGHYIHFTPAVHFSRRGLWDGNRSLWGSFVIEHDQHRVFFAGDTGFGAHFEQIAKQFAPLDLSLLPIGAYMPRSVMGPIHMSPNEAVQAHQLLQSKYSMGIHWGTFQLTDEGRLDPILELQHACLEEGVSSDTFFHLEPSESRLLSFNRASIGP